MVSLMLLSGEAPVPGVTRWTIVSVGASGVFTTGRSVLIPLTSVGLVSPPTRLQAEKEMMKRNTSTGIDRRMNACMSFLLWRESAYTRDRIGQGIFTSPSIGSRIKSRLPESEGSVHLPNPTIKHKIIIMTWIYGYKCHERTTVSVSSHEGRIWKLYAIVNLFRIGGVYATV
jgi:hypothetical protein